MGRHHGHLTSEEKKKIRQERKVLRKDLKAKGITKRKEFEKIAQMLGLVYYEDYPWFLWWLWRLWDFLKGVALWKYILIGLGVLGLTFLFSVLANQKGNFLVTMSSTMSGNQLSLSDKEDLSEDKIRLISDVLKEVNAYSLQDMPDNLDSEGEGSHNMDDVVCYTFWVTNRSEAAYGVEWYMLFSQSTKNVEQATWLMVYVDGEMTLYSTPAADGSAEKIGPYGNAPLIDQAADPTQYQAEGETYMVESYPYLENKIVAKGVFDNMMPGETHKFTVVIWVDGDDPDCTDDLIGGHAGFNMKFTGIDDNDDIYTKYGRAETSDELERTGIAGAIDDLWDGFKKKGCFGVEEY